MMCVECSTRLKVFYVCVDDEDEVEKNFTSELQFVQELDFE